MAFRKSSDTRPQILEVSPEAAIPGGEFRIRGKNFASTEWPRVRFGEVAAPLVIGHPVAEPETVATAIRIGNPASWQGAIDARDQSEGDIRAVEDTDILAAQRDLATLEGVFCEPASAASLAVLRAAVQDGTVAPGATAVCVLTGHGLKDATATAQGLRAPTPVDGDAASLAAALGRNGITYFRRHYAWPVIERRYLDTFDRLSREAPDTRPAMAPLPGFFARRRPTLAPANEVLASVPAGASTR